ncbi:MAG: hypothetical protein GF400_06735 [Candidatus Eisenbacteria bacterium]|nr:hypothetical protein [Candidatus Eisenbacteria bacterium]
MRAISIIIVLLLVAVAAFAETYNTPTIDGVVNIAPDDWDADDFAVDDPSDDCRYAPNDPDMDDLYITWDADSLYVGIVTARPPGGFGNGYLIFIDTDAQNGITGATDFTSADYYPRRITFSTMGADVVMGAWNLGGPFMKFCQDPTSTTDVPEQHAVSDTSVKHIEVAVSWNGLFGLGVRAVPANTTLRFIAAIVGGDGTGAYDAMPTSSTGLESDPETPFDAETELDVYYEAVVDNNGDGVPDTGYSPVESTSWGRIKGMFTE